MFGSQVANGGFYWDDWNNAAEVHFASEPGLFGALHVATERPVFSYRPVLTELLTLQYHSFGLNKHVYLAIAALFGAATAFSLYLLLRTMSLPPPDAAVPSTLLLLFPWTDSTRMWNTASFDTLAVTLYLLGAVAAVTALRGPPGRRRALLTALSLTLYLLAAWTYEIVTFAVLASITLYLLVAPRRDALKRWLLDVLLVGIALAVVASGTTRTPLSFGDQVDHAVTIAGQSFSLLARAVFPVGDVPGVIGAVVLVVLVGAALASRRAELRPWLAAAGLGALWVAAGYALFVPAAAYYKPLAPGVINRMNVLAAVGFSVLVYALARLAAGLVTPRHARAAAAVACAAIAVGYVVKVADDQDGWQRSADVQAQVLSAIRVGVPDPPPRGTTVYTFNAPSFVAPGIPAFSLPFDLRAAVRLKYDDESLRAYPIRGHDVIECAQNILFPRGGTYGPVHGARYGSAWFVSVPRRRAFRVDTRAQCLDLRKRLGAARA
jgi:hypothetical protein